MTDAGIMVPFLQNSFKLKHSVGNKYNKNQKQTYVHIGL